MKQAAGVVPLTAPRRLPFVLPPVTRPIRAPKRAAMAQEYDKIIKENLEKIVLPLIRRTTGIEPVAGETLYPALHYTIEREADFVQKVTTKDGQTIVFHVEFQTTNEKAMVDRMFVYAALIYHAFRLPVRQIVFYIGKGALKMESTLAMPLFEYRYDLVDLQQVSYKEFIGSSLPEEVLLAILGNFGGAPAETVIEEILTRLRTLQESDLALGRSIRQLSMLSMLRDLQPFILKKVERMAFTIDITKDFFYQQGEKQGEESKALEIAANLLKEGLPTEVIQRVTQLPAAAIEALREKPPKGGRKKR